MKHKAKNTVRAVPNLLRNLLLIAALASCSVSGGGSLGIEGGEILARVITGGDTVFRMEFRLGGGMDEYIEETGTYYELKQKTFSFSGIPAGTTVDVLCRVVYDDGTAEGQEVCRAGGSGIVIQAGRNDIKLKMEKTLGGPGISFDLPDFQGGIEVVLDKAGKALSATEGYSAYQWFVNGAEQSSTTSALDISGLASGVYQIAVIADGVYSARYELVWTN